MLFWSIKPRICYVVFLCIRGLLLYAFETVHDLHFAVDYASENWSFPTPQMGHTQSSGSSLNALPSTLGSYSYPQTSQMYFAIDVVFNVIVFVFSVQRYKKYFIYANKYRKIVDFSYCTICVYGNCSKSRIFSTLFLSILYGLNRQPKANWILKCGE